MAKAIVSVYFDDLEKEMIEKVAASEDRNLSNFIRRAALRDIKERYGLTVEQTSLDQPGE